MILVRKSRMIGKEKRCMDMMNNKTKRVVASVIAGLLVLIMVVTMFVPYIQ